MSYESRLPTSSSKRSRRRDWLSPTSLPLNCKLVLCPPAIDMNLFLMLNPCSIGHADWLRKLPTRARRRRTPRPCAAYRGRPSRSTTTGESWRFCTKGWVFASALHRQTQSDPSDAHPCWFTRFDKLDRRQWREPYKALILLEYLLTHGPGSIADEFQSDTEAIRDLGNIEYIDERGLALMIPVHVVVLCWCSILCLPQLRWFLHRFDWGVAAREKTVRVLKLLEKGPHLKEERERARKISRGIQGFGSFNLSWSSTAVHRPELVDSRVHDAIVNSEKENSKRDAGIDRQIRRAAGTARRRPLQENSGYKNLATEGTASPATTKMHLPEESKPLLHYWRREI